MLQANYFKAHLPNTDAINKNNIKHFILCICIIMHYYFALKRAIILENDYFQINKLS